MGPVAVYLNVTPALAIASIQFFSWLVMPKLLNYIVAIYLIAIGLIGLMGAGQMHLG